MSTIKVAAAFQPQFAASLTGYWCESQAAQCRNCSLASMIRCSVTTEKKAVFVVCLFADLNRCFMSRSDRVDPDRCISVSVPPAASCLPPSPPLQILVYWAEGWRVSAVSLFLGALKKSGYSQLLENLCALKDVTQHNSNSYQASNSHFLVQLLFLVTSHAH